MAASKLQMQISSSPTLDTYAFPMASTTKPMFWELVGILCNQTGSGETQDGDFRTSITHMYCLACLSKLQLSHWFQYQKTSQSISHLRKIRCFPLPVWLHNILMSTNGMLGPENVGIAVTMLLISCLGAEIHAIEVYRPPSWISPLPVWSHNILMNPNEKLTPKTYV